MTRMTKEQIMQAVRALSKDKDTDPQSRYEMLGEIGQVVDQEADTLYDENDVEDIDLDDEWEPTDPFGLDDEDDFDDEDDDFDFDDEDDFDPED